MLEQEERNHPSRFWRIAYPCFSDEDWEKAFRAVETDFFSSGGSLISFVNGVLLERQFGPNHWHLSHSKKLFYQIKPFIPRVLQIGLRQIYRSSQERQGTLNWPIEDRYVRFQYELVRRLIGNKGLSEVPYIGFWPGGKDFAFVLTHDVETEEGFKAIAKIVELEKQYGFRSIFNIVPEGYPIDRAYLDSLRAEGFEIGIHGLKHDGKLFFSREVFSKRAKKINGYLNEYNAKGFRSPLTHRNPEWMQELECDYDMSFFDTDPYESMPGGTMSIWPFLMGHFVELPYTLPQDHTLLVILKEVTPRIWLEKVDFIERYRGMALVLVHPDYMIDDDHFRVYEQFLSEMARFNCWHALPKDVAEWWRRRDLSEIRFDKEGNPYIEGPAAKDGSIAYFRID